MAGVMVVVGRYAVITEAPRGARVWWEVGRDGAVRAVAAREVAVRAGVVVRSRTRRQGGAIGGLGAGVRTEPRGGKIGVRRRLLLLARARAHGSSPPPCNSLARVGTSTVNPLALVSRRAGWSAPS